jgi:hypothetical protein
MIALFVLFALLCLAAADPCSELDNAKRAHFAREAKKPEHQNHNKPGKHKKGRTHKHKGKKDKHRQ